MNSARRMPSSPHATPDPRAELLAAGRALAVAAAALIAAAGGEHVPELDDVGDTSDHDRPRLALVPSPPAVCAPSAVDAVTALERRRALARKRQAEHRAKARGEAPSRFPVTPPVTRVTHVTPVSVTEPVEKTVSEHVPAHVTCQKHAAIAASVGCPMFDHDRPAVTLVSVTCHAGGPLSRGVTASASSSFSAASALCSVTSLPSPPLYSRAHERDARSTMAGSSGAPPPPAAEPVGRRDKREVWACVQHCGRVHVALMGHGTATFADPAVSHPSDCATCGGPCKVTRRPSPIHHRFAMYDACLYFLPAARRALIDAGHPALLDDCMRVVALAYRQHVRTGGAFMVWRASFQSAELTGAAMSDAVKRWTRQRGAEGRETSTTAASSELADLSKSASRRPTPAEVAAAARNLGKPPPGRSR